MTAVATAIIASAVIGGVVAKQQSIGQERIARTRNQREDRLRVQNETQQKRQAALKEDQLLAQNKLEQSSKRRTVNTQLNTKGISRLNDFGSVTDSVLNEQQVSV